MDEIKVEMALDIIQRKISKLIKDNKETNFEKFNSQLKLLTEEREKIYDLDEEVINKVFDIYLKELKEEV